MSHEKGACAYQIVSGCTAGCKPKELCPAGWVVYRRWSGGGHHHSEKGTEE